jgi:hypothetical protein
MERESGMATYSSVAGIIHPISRAIRQFQQKGWLAI